MTDETAMAKLMDGVHTVISAVQGGPDVIVDGQLRLLEVAKKSGVVRFVPSTFSYNIWAVPKGNNVNTDWRLQFDERAQEQRGDVEICHVSKCVLMRLPAFR
jgi:hypothetical protein